LRKDEWQHRLKVGGSSYSQRRLGNSNRGVGNSKKSDEEAFGNLSWHSVCLNLQLKAKSCLR